MRRFFLLLLVSDYFWKNREIKGLFQLIFTSLLVLFERAFYLTCEVMFWLFQLMNGEIDICWDDRNAVWYCNWYRVLRWISCGCKELFVRLRSASFRSFKKRTASYVDWWSLLLGYTREVCVLKAKRSMIWLLYLEKGFEMLIFLLWTTLSRQNLIFLLFGDK